MKNIKNNKESKETKESDNEYCIINDIELYDFIYKFDSKKENLDKHNISFEHTTTQTHDSFISYFDMEGYIENIKKSYNSEEKIMSQFQKDYHRQDIKLNGYNYTENEFINKIKNLLFDMEMTKIYNLSWNMLIFLLCCQSSYCLPYKILMQKYNINNSENKLLICDSKTKKNLETDITINKEKIIVELKICLYVKDIEKNINTHKINSTITIELSKKEKEKEKKYKNEPCICVFGWTIYCLTNNPII